MHYSANFVNSYVTYVCPMKRSFIKSKTCLQMLPAPPLDVQESIVGVLERVPPSMRGYLMDSLVHERIEDAQFLVSHIDAFEEFARIAAVSQQMNEEYDQFDDTEA